MIHVEGVVAKRCLRNVSVKDDINSLKDKIRACYDSDTTNNTAICNEEEELKKFIRNLSTDSLPNTYRLIIEYNDLTFASIEIG